MADGTLKVGTITTSSGSGTITLGQSGETIALGSGVTSKMNQPAFEAYLSSDQTVSNNVLTKVQMDTEIFDTDNMYDNSTNYRFTPTVAGKYYVYASIKIFGDGDIEMSNTHIYKNGSLYKGAIFDPVNTSSSMNASNLSNSAVINMNGTSDYLEIFGLVQSGNARQFQTATKNTYFGAYRIGA